MRLFQLPKEGVAALPPHGGILLETKDAPQMWSYAAPQLRLESEWVVAFDVDAPDPRSAQGRVERDLLPRFLAALNTLGPEPYLVELIAVESVGEPRRASPVFTPPAAFGAQWVDPLTDVDRQALEARLRAMAEDRVAGEAGLSVVRGVALSYLGAAEPTAAAAGLLRFHLALERVVQAVAKALRQSRPDEERAERERIAAEYFQAMTTSADDGQRAALIEEAARELRQAALLVADVQIRGAAAELRVAPELIEEAVALAKFRSDALGHGGDASEVEVARWMDGPDHRAFRLVTVFLTAYMDWAMARATT